MTSCSTSACGIGGWVGPLPGDPDNNSVLSATPAFGGIDVSWSYPTVNPEAVAHTLLYRGLAPDFSTALLISVVAGSAYYDKSDPTLIRQYFYWIQIVSRNGTVGGLIGPATAVAKPPIEDMIELLSDRINVGQLSQSLRTEIDKVTLNYSELLAEVDNRIAANTAFSSALAQVQTGVSEAMTLLNTEIVERQEGDSAFVSALNTVASANALNSAAIQQVSTARVDGDAANALLFTTLNSQVNNPTTGLPATRATLLNDYYTKTGTNDAISLATTGLVSTVDLGTALNAYTTTAALQESYYTKANTNAAIATATENLVASTTLADYATTAALQTRLTTQIGYAVRAGTSIPFDGNGATIVYRAADYPTAEYPEYAVDRTRIIDSLGVDLWNAQNEEGLLALTWLQGLPLASAIQTMQVTGPDGSAAALQTAFEAQKDLNNEFKAQYTAKVTIDQADGTKLIGGFGLYGSEDGIEAGFDVSTFWIGDSATKIKPFIVTDNQVFIDQAVINELTFSKLRDEDGLVMVEDGKIKANYLKVEEIAGGAFTGFVWPAPVGTGPYTPESYPGGFYLGPSGLLLGNYNSGKYLQVDSNGDIRTPTFTVINGFMTANQFATPYGRFSVSSDGTVIADRVSIRRRDAVATGSGYWGSEFITSVTTNDDSGGFA